MNQIWILESNRETCLWRSRRTERKKKGKPSWSPMKLNWNNDSIKCSGLNQRSNQNVASYYLGDVTVPHKYPSSVMIARQLLNFRE